MIQGVYLCMKYEIEQMLSQDDKSGTIVNVASVAGMTGNPGGSIYAASKSGVIALTEVRLNYQYPRLCLQNPLTARLLQLNMDPPSE